MNKCGNEMMMMMTMKKEKNYENKILRSVINVV